MQTFWNRTLTATYFQACCNVQIFHPPETTITTLYKHAPTSCLNASIALTQVCNEHTKKVRRLTTVTKMWAVTLGCHFQHNNPTEQYTVSQCTSFGQRTYVTSDATSATLTRHYRSVSAQHQRHWRIILDAHFLSACKTIHRITAHFSLQDVCHFGLYGADA